MLFVAIHCRTSVAIELNCTYTQVTFAVTGSIYTCTATVLFNGDSDVTNVTGNHQVNRGNSDVQALRIQSQNLPFFPTNVEEFFPNTKAFSFYNNSITSISNDHLSPFPDLLYLRLLRNRITSLDTNVFSGLAELKFIDLDLNEIRHVGHAIDLPDTDGYMYFRDNMCIDKVAYTAEEIALLRFDLLRNCPPTISQIEDTLASRPNFITDLQIRTLQLEARVAQLEEIIENKLKVN